MYAQKKKPVPIQKKTPSLLHHTLNTPLVCYASDTHLLGVIQRVRARGLYQTKEVTRLRQTASPHNEIIAVPQGALVDIVDDRVNNFAVKLIPRDHRWGLYRGQAGWIATTRLQNDPVANGTAPLDNATINGYWTTYRNNNAPALFSLANLQYVSVSNGVVGSIYFEDAATGNNGRIRLNHPYGPAVESHVNPVEVYTHNNANTAKPSSSKRGEGMVATRLFMINNGWHNPPRVGEYVYELWANGPNVAASHPSRGQYTAPVNFTQNMINVLYHAVQTEQIGNSIMSKLRNHANMAAQINA
ncbi:hypothetical protein [uncultured Shewanella sp.]|uniref:hypothetical protein n=1 Tax=uncultured Shewanella sp. TaxID=173975 RepID=UPI0026309348|nr:hypothetical protein [uncultured Shewanella sp.]